MSKGKIITLLLTLGLLFLSLCYKQGIIVLPLSASEALQQNPITDISDRINAIQFPETTAIQNSPIEERVAPFSISTPNNDQNWFIKLKSTENKANDVVIYIGPGERVEVTVPLGNYNLYYATGSYWHGDVDLFGKGTMCYKSEETYVFVADDAGYHGKSVELYMSVADSRYAKSVSVSEMNSD